MSQITIAFAYAYLGFTGVYGGMYIGNRFYDRMRHNGFPKDVAIPLTCFSAVPLGILSGPILMPIVLAHTSYEMWEMNNKKK